MKVSIFIFVLATTFAASNSAFAQTIAAADISEIVLETSDGFCADCERMTILRANGAATYHGGKNSRLRKGDFSGQISWTQFARLAKTIIEAGFFNYKPRYEGTTSDVATVKITVICAGGRKTVEDFKRRRESKLKLIEQAFDQTAGEIEWRTGDAPTNNN